MVQGRKPNVAKRRSVARLHEAGYSVPQIARQLGATYQTVYHSLARLRRGTVVCSECHAAISAPQGSLRTQGVVCRACLARLPSVSFWRRLLSLRLMAGLTQSELAHRAGLSASAVHTLERGLCQPRPRTRQRLLAYLNSTVKKRHEA
jgi:DNA-binding XRE family transcriptional regulator